MKNNIHVIINKFSGTVLRLGEDTVTKMIQDALGSRLKALHMTEASQMCAKIDELGHADDVDLLVGGGDGTAVCAAEHLKDRGVHFGVLPLGTMNLLAQDLGSASTFEETMKRLTRLYEDKIDLGVVNGRFFLCSAVIGLVPESAIVREEIREEGTIDAVSRFVSTIARGMAGNASNVLNIRQQDSDNPIRLETTSLIISNNRFVKNPDVAAERFLRESLKGGNLAVYSAAPKDIMDGLRLMVKMVQGTWQEDDAIFSFETPSMIVDTEQNETLISLDGEPLEMKSPLKFSIEHNKLAVFRMELAA